MTHRDRAGEPAVGDSMGASGSLDDVPQDPRLPSYPPLGPTDRLRDLYESLSTLLGISSRYHGCIETRRDAAARAPGPIGRSCQTNENWSPNAGNHGSQAAS